MRRLALATILVASSAYAQTTAPVGTDNGFFRPTPGNDPSLTNYLVPLQGAPQPQPAQPAPPPPAAVIVPMPLVASTSVSPPAQAEEAVDKAIREAEEARAKAGITGPPINGAFTGQTSERDR